VEAAALAEVFGARRVPVVSIKGAVGEFAAVGAATLMAALECLRAGVIPPTTGLQQIAGDCPVDASPAARPARGGTALLNAFAGGGTNYALVIRAAEGADSGKRIAESG
jgi:3-oxoacyl-(acyl-carrier-protein) synthase